MGMYKLPEELDALVAEVEQLAFEQGLEFYDEDGRPYEEFQETIDAYREQIRQYVRSLGQQAQPSVPSDSLEPQSAVEHRRRWSDRAKMGDLHPD